MASSASTRMQENSARLTARRKSSSESLRKVGKEFRGARQPLLPEGAGAADMVFPEARLRFVNAERDRGAGRQAVVVFGQALVVEPVAGLVHDAEERGE